MALQAGVGDINGEVPISLKGFGNSASLWEKLEGLTPSDIWPQIIKVAIASVSGML